MKKIYIYLFKSICQNKFYKLQSNISRVFVLHFLLVWKFHRDNFMKIFPFKEFRSTFRGYCFNRKFIYYNCLYVNSVKKRILQINGYSSVNARSTLCLSFIIDFPVEFSFWNVSGHSIINTSFSVFPYTRRPLRYFRSLSDLNCQSNLYYTNFRLIELHIFP